MSIKSKIESAKTDDWLAEGLTEEEIKKIIQSAKAETYKDMLNSLLTDPNPYGIDEYAYMCNRIKSVFNTVINNAQRGGLRVAPIEETAIGLILTNA